MRPIDDSRDRGNSSLVVALTGDGRSEKKILRALARRYDGHDKALLLPTKPPPVGANRRRNGRFTGLSAFRVVRTYVETWGFSEFLFIVDIEHFGSNRTSEGLQTEIDRGLSGFGFEERDITPLGDRAYRVTCRLGLHGVRLNTVLSGTTRRVEEDISELLRLEYGRTVAPSKGAIRIALEQQGLDLGTLLTNCRACNLSAAFSGLVVALRDFENQNTT